ncbi:peptidoglycan-binding domain-containing protein [Geotalea sp. SG265]|uniref:peptidoglycan-binding domain-containing protein n=1 Tax=Geotalea sp. SG265 TaxID=2922867 RepID=UPI001FAFFEEC|nr:peptidoglycan-binding domain-containing protein [Geotalea sp. SG265]
MGALSDSVGINGANLKQDVMRVQRILKTAGFDPGPDDGACGDQTVSAIKGFQSSFMDDPDGFIPTEGLTWRKLAEAQQQAVEERKES